MALSFRDPWWLLLLLLVPLLTWLRFYWRRRRVRVTFSDTTALDGLPVSLAVRLRHLLPLLFAVGLSLLVLALARPRLGIEEVRSPRDVVDIALVVDVSSSMEGLDFSDFANKISRNRLQAAKIVLRKFIASREKDRMCLIAFAGIPFTLSPLTSEQAWLERQLDQINILMFTREHDGTAIGTALGTAVARLKKSKADSKVVVLLTDGVNNTGDIDPEVAAQLANDLGIRVYTVAAGRTGTVPFPGPFGRPVMQQSVIDIETLQNIATQTNGKFFHAEDFATLESVYTEIDELERTEIETEITVRWQERYPPFALLGLAFIALTLLLSTTRLSLLS